MAQAPRCTWQRTGCAQAAPPTPPPPPPAGHKYTVGEAKFYGTNLLCELDAPNEVRPLYHYPVPVYSDLLLRLLDWSLVQFFIDQQTQTLYFFPPVPLSQWLESPFITQRMVTADISGTSHITLRGLGFHHSRGNGLLAMNVTGAI